MLYFLLDENNRALSFSEEEFPNSVAVDKSLLPDDWYEIFNSIRLGIYDGIPFYYPLDHDGQDQPIEEQIAQNVDLEQNAPTEEVLD